MKQVILLMILMLFSLPSFTQVKIKLRKIETPQQIKKNPSVNKPNNEPKPLTSAQKEALRKDAVKKQNSLLEDEKYKKAFAKDKKIDWIEIPAGSFTMGSPSSEADRSSSETQHQVTLSSFRMSKYEVTFAQFDVFCVETGWSKPNDEGWGRGNRPVINVSWDDATAFAQWMGCRLPTEAEWEYACRAGTTTPFNTGENLTTNQANYNGNSPYQNFSKGTYLAKTMPVGSYPPNAWGLHDMHGNVWEWCSDWYGDYNTSQQTNPQGPSYGSDRVGRGGSWLNDAEFCRSAYRNRGEPSGRSDALGFRLVAP